MLYDYAQQVASASVLGKPAGLPALLLHGFDTDQIWAELELYNRPVLSQFGGYATSLNQDPTALNEDEESDEDASAQAAGLEGESAQSTGSEGESEAETKEAQQPDDSEQEEVEDETGDESSGKEGKKAAKAAAPTAAELDEFEQLEEDDDKTDLRDQELEELERFDAMMEDMDERRARGELDDDEMIDLNDGLGEDDDELEVAKGLTWADFMSADTPARGKKGPVSQKRSRAHSDGLDEEQDEDEDAAEDAEEDEDEQENEDENGAATEVKTEGAAVEPVGALSSHQKRQLEMQKQIKELEEQMLRPRAWDLIGEVTAAKRPENSLLEKVLDANYLGVGTMGEEIDEEQTDLTIEGMIKQRIKDQAFDDPVRKVPTKEKEFRAKEELSVEKSKFGLAEIYEREYLEMQREDNKTAVDDKLAQEHKEISVLFATLCHQLDSLSNFHMTPKPPREEMQVASQPALNMEEAIPLAVSDARTKAPHETFESKSRGAPVAREEMTKEEKVAQRLKKKKRRQKKTHKAVAEKTPDSLAAANELIRTSKNIESVDTSKQAKVNFTNSTTFFTAVQDGAAAGTGKRPNKKKQKTGESGQLKL